MGNRREREEYSTQIPFGNTDGALTEIREVPAGFIRFDTRFGDIALHEGEQRVRVLVGRMGAGKTIYLRRLHDYNSNELTSVYTANAAYSAQVTTSLTTSNVEYLCLAFHNHELTEMWKMLWRRAIVRAAVSHLLHSERLKDYLDAGDLEVLKSSEFRSLLGQLPIATDVASQCQRVISDIRKRHPKPRAERTQEALRSYLTDGRWDSIEARVYDMLAKCPTMFFYVDAIDDEFHASPSCWMRAQKGLFYTVYALLRENRWREKLHVVIAIRDLVLSSVYTSEHAPRYYNEPHTRILSWDSSSIRYFLERRIQDLPKSLLIRPAASSTFERWLGIDRIENVTRGTVEDLETYLVRHTRCIPRDIVQLGNRLCEYVRMVKSEQGRSVDPAEIRDIVSKAAMAAAGFQLNFCVNHIASGLETDAIRHEPYYGALEASNASGHETLHRLLTSLKFDKFDREVLQGLIDDGRKAYNSIDIDISSILWQNGLIGYLQNGHGSASGEVEYNFYHGPSVGSSSIPIAAKRFALHPIVLDLMPFISPVGSPVVPASVPL
jgi:hypothetical protein